MTAPYAPDTEELLPELGHIARAWLELPDGSTRDLVLLEPCSLTIDSRQAPRYAATLTCVAPDDAAQLAETDPRRGIRVHIEAGYRRPGNVEDVHELADLTVRTIRVPRPGSTMTLTARSDESLLLDNAASASVTIDEATTADAVVEAVSKALPDAVWEVDVTTPGPAIDEANPLADKWDLARDYADRIGAELYADGARVWHLADVPEVGDPVATLTVAQNGEPGTMLESDSAIDREDGWANRVLLVYSWTDASNVAHTIRAVRSVTTGPFAAVDGVNVRCEKVERRDIPVTQTEADAAATALVARMVNRGRTVNLTNLAMYWLRPGHTIDVDLPIGDPEAHLLDSVTFDLALGTMATQSRLPDNTGTIGA